MFCHKCGGEVPGNVRFCHRCGVKLHEPIPQPSVSAQPIPTTAVGVARRKRRPTKKQMIALLSSVLAIVLLLSVGLLSSDGNIQKNAERVMYLEMYDGRNKLIGSASGFFIVNGRTLVTNYHVIEDAHSITVHTADGRRSTKATTVLAYDKRADLAILRCDADLGVKPLGLADSDAAEQGDKIFAVGYPLGLSNTMSDGIISSRYYDNGVDVLQITAAISHGSSGGAVFNERGAVIGVTSAYYDGGQNLNIAVASNTVRRIYENRSGAPTTLATLNR